MLLKKPYYCAVKNESCYSRHSWGGSINSLIKSLLFCKSSKYNKSLCNTFLFSFDFHGSILQLPMITHMLLHLSINSSLVVTNRRNPCKTGYLTFLTTVSLQATACSNSAMKNEYIFIKNTTQDTK